MTSVTIFGVPQKGVERRADVLCGEAKGVEREAFQKRAEMRPMGTGGGDRGKLGGRAPQFRSRCSGEDASERGG